MYMHYAAWVTELADPILGRCTPLITSCSVPRPDVMLPNSQQPPDHFLTARHSLSRSSPVPPTKPFNPRILGRATVLLLLLSASPHCYNKSPVIRLIHSPQSVISVVRRRHSYSFSIPAILLGILLQIIIIVLFRSETLCINQRHHVLQLRHW